MRTLALVPALVIATLLGQSCGVERPAGTAGNESSLVGGTCLNNSECDQGLCQAGTAFPGGICTLSCGSSNDCPRASSCAEVATGTPMGWVCLVDCGSDGDCRTDYVCGSFTEAGTDGGSTVRVCVGPEATR